MSEMAADNQTPLNRHPVAGHPCRLRHGLALPMVVGFWVVVVAAGMYSLWRYEFSEGTVGQPPVHWPAESRLAVTEGQPTLILFAHPKCPCTRASLGELEKIMTHCADHVRAYAVFVRPLEFSSDTNWEKTDLWTSAAEIPGVKRFVDINGTEARRFHAATSGLALLYDKRGQLIFRGGITASRGHSGDNTGQSAIVDLLLRGSAGVNSTNVYGCDLVTNTCQSDQPCHQP